jgi:hypothetical protein
MVLAKENSSPRVTIEEDTLTANYHKVSYKREKKLDILSELPAGSCFIWSKPWNLVF